MKPATPPISAAIRAWVSARREQIVADLADAIRLRSENPPGNEGLVAEFLEGRLKALGADIQWQEIAPGRPNLVASFDFGPPPGATRAPSLMLTTHMDVVPAKGATERDLFEPVIEDGRLYGRGACDAKGALVAMLAACGAVVDVARAGYPLAGRLVFAAVAAEESGGHGTQHLVARGPLTDYAIVGEPSSLQVALGHKGSYRREVTFFGQAAHSSDPGRGVNAIYRAARFVGEVERWHQRLQGVRNPLFGSPSVSANVIHGGIKVNVIPDRCAVQIDRRLNPGETTEQAHGELLAILERLRDGDPTLTWSIADLGMDKEPAAVAPEAVVVQALADAVETVTGRRGFAVFRGGTDMTFLMRAGVETAIFGPGSIDQAHAVDEFVPVAELWHAAEIYAMAACRLLSPSSGDVVEPGGHPGGEGR